MTRPESAGRRPYRYWTAQELELLSARWAQSSVAEMAAALGRDEKSVRNKAGALGLARGGTGRAWSSREVETLRRLYGLVSAQDVARHLGRPTRAVYQKAHELGITRKGWD